MYDEGIHLAGFGGEAGDAIATLFRGAEFELEEGRVQGVDYGEVVGHCRGRLGKLWLRMVQLLSFGVSPVMPLLLALV